ncbi:MAG: hypothetical protein COB67_02605 [SAR324 cluster bacterium]|uniref:Uncharacterized protein n=1 Tax=SAR324 cluster bacterium TaxID=2024889 RepID=A0A2A4T984_9DELT|nr:MAG: hypothetical protein COB67_02605 [SAR324 cluster bacterium]
MIPRIYRAVRHTFIFYFMVWILTFQGMIFIYDGNRDEELISLLMGLVLMLSVIGSDVVKSLAPKDSSLDEKSVYGTAVFIDKDLPSSKEPKISQ